MKDIRSYEPLAEKGVVSICYEKETDEKGEVYTKGYTDFEEYSENVVNSKKKEIIDKEVQSIKKELMQRESYQQKILEELNSEGEKSKELEEQRKYVQTDSYIIEMAREKLGLVFPDEIAIKAEK